MDVIDVPIEPERFDTEEWLSHFGDLACVGYSDTLDEVEGDCCSTAASTISIYAARICSSYLLVKDHPEVETDLELYANLADLKAALRGWRRYYRSCDLDFSLESFRARDLPDTLPWLLEFADEVSDAHGGKAFARAAKQLFGRSVSQSPVGLNVGQAHCSPAGEFAMLTPVRSSIPEYHAKILLYLAQLAKIPASACVFLCSPQAQAPGIPAAPSVLLASREELADVQKKLQVELKAAEKITEREAQQKEVAAAELVRCQAALTLVADYRVFAADGWRSVSFDISRLLLDLRPQIKATPERLRFGDSVVECMARSGAVFTRRVKDLQAGSPDLFPQLAGSIRQWEGLGGQTGLESCVPLLAKILSPGNQLERSDWDALGIAYVRARYLVKSRNQRCGFFSFKPQLSPALAAVADAFHLPVAAVALTTTWAELPTVAFQQGKSPMSANQRDPILARIVDALGPSAPAGVESAQAARETATSAHAAALDRVERIRLSLADLRALELPPQSTRESQRRYKDRGRG